MPRISAPTLAAHRDLRRATLLAAARDIVLDRGARALTMGALAQRAGLSRPAVYEYFSSVEDVLGQVAAAELDALEDELRQAVDSRGTPEEQVAVYVATAMGWAADGRLRLSGALAGLTLPDPVRTGAIRRQHRLGRVLVGTMGAMGLPDPAEGADLVHGAVETAVMRVGGGADPGRAAATTTAFVLAGLRTLMGPPGPG